MEETNENSGFTESLSELLPFGELHDELVFNYYDFTRIWSMSVKNNPDLYLVALNVIDDDITVGENILAKLGFLVFEVPGEIALHEGDRYRFRFRKFIQESPQIWMVEFKYFNDTEFKNAKKIRFEDIGEKLLPRDS